MNYLWKLWGWLNKTQRERHKVTLLVLYSSHTTLVDCIISTNVQQMYMDPFIISIFVYWCQCQCISTPTEHIYASVCILNVKHIINYSHGKCSRKYFLRYSSFILTFLPHPINGHSWVCQPIMIVKPKHQHRTPPIWNWVNHPQRWKAIQKRGPPSRGSGSN